MADEEQPSWLSANNNSSAPSAPPQSSRQPSTSGGNTGPEPPYKSLVKATFFFFNLGFMIFLAATGALGIAAAGASGNINSSGAIFVGIYLMLFAAMVFIFECSQMIPGATSLDNLLKRNVGFLYGMIGKGIFICFCGALAFGLSSPRKLAIACGILVSAWGPFQICVYLKWPEYFDKKEKYNPERE